MEACKEGLSRYFAAETWRMRLNQQSRLLRKWAQHRGDSRCNLSEEDKVLECWGQMGDQCCRSSTRSDREVRVGLAQPDHTVSHSTGVGFFPGCSGKSSEEKISNFCYRGWLNRCECAEYCPASAVSLFLPSCLFVPTQTSFRSDPEVCTLCLLCSHLGCSSPVNQLCSLL